MAKTIGSLLAEIGLDTANFDNGIKRVKTLTSSFMKTARRNFAAVRKSVNKMGGAFGRLASMVIALVGPAALGALTKKSFEVIDAAAKTADTFGITTKALEGLTLAAQRNGATAEQVKKSLEKLAVNGQDAADGIGTAADAFRKLNIDAKEIVKLPLDEQFKIVADSMKNVKTATERVSIAYDIFGRQGTNMVKTLRLSREELEKFEERAERLGVAVNRFDSSKVEEANDAFMEAQKAMTGVGNIIAVTVAPLVTALANRFIDASLEANGFRDNVGNGMNAVLTAVGFVLDSIHGIGVAYEVAKLAMMEFVNLGIQSVGRLAYWTNEYFNVWRDRLGQEIVPFHQTAMGNLVGQFQAGIEKAREDVNKKLLEPLPSESLQEWVAEAVATADKHAAIVVGTQEKAKEELDKINNDAKDMNQELAKSIKVDLFDPATSVFDQLRKSFQDVIQGMINDWFNSQLMDIFKGMNGPGGEGGIGGFVSSIVSSFPGFASGGQFTVGGKAGRDANLVPLRLTKGETVTVTPSGQNSGSGSSVSFHNTFDFRGSSLDAEEVITMIEQSQRVVKSQIQDEIGRGRL